MGGYIAETSSWRNAFFWFGATGVLYASLLLFLLKDRRAENDAEAKLENVSVLSALRALLAQAGF